MAEREVALQLNDTISAQLKPNLGLPNYVISVISVISAISAISAISVQCVMSVMTVMPAMSAISEMPDACFGFGSRARRFLFQRQVS